jgi:hypothetical protein
MYGLPIGGQVNVFIIAPSRRMSSLPVSAPPPVLPIHPALERRCGRLPLRQYAPKPTNRRTLLLAVQIRRDLHSRRPPLTPIAWPCDVPRSDRLLRHQPLRGRSIATHDDRHLTGVQQLKIRFDGNLNPVLGCCRAWRGRNIPIIGPLDRSSGYRAPVHRDPLRSSVSYHIFQPYFMRPGSTTIAPRIASEQPQHNL